METSETFSIPDELPVLFLANTVICPYAVVPLSIQSEESKAAIRNALMRDRLIVGVKAQETDPTGIATVCRVAKAIGMPDGSLQVIVQGLERVRLGEVLQKNPFYISRVALYPDPQTSDATITALQETAIEQFLRLAPFIPHLPAAVIDSMSSYETPLMVAYVITTFLYTTSFQQQRVLEADMVKEKFEIITTYLTEELAKRELGTQKPTKNQIGLESAQQTNPSSEFQQKKSVVVLGKNGTTHKDVTLTLRNFDLGGYFIGIKRMGKSTLMENLVMQSIEYNRGICLIDPHGDLVNTVMTRIPRERIEKGNVILLDPKDTSFPFGLNIYHCEDKDDPVAVEYTTNLVMDLYKKLWKAEYSQPMVEDVILMTTLTIIANNMTMVEVPRLLFDDAFRQQLVKNVRNPDVLDFWKIYDNPRSIEREQGGGTIGRRIRQFTSSGIMRYIVGQSEKSLRLRDILDQRKILLIRLYSDLPQLTSLIGSTIVSQMLQAALSRSDTDKRPTVHLYCDEYSRFAVESFAQIISEAGKYNIIPFIAHQSRGQISEENQDSAIQLGSLFAFRLIGIDAEVIANEFNLDPAKLPPTIPRNVLDYIDRHPSDVVKDFAGGYILRLRNALGKKEKRETFPDVGSFEYGPYHDFGEGEVEFKPDRAQDAFNLIETLLYEAMRQESIPQTELRQVITEMAPLLKYEYYYAWHYLQDFSDYVQNEKAIHSKADKALKWREPDIPKLLEKVNLNDYDLAWVLFGENEKKTKEEVWQHLVKNAEEKRRWFPPTMHELLESIESTTYVLLRNALEEWEKRNDTATHRTIRQFSKTWKNPISLLIPDENKETIVVDGIGVFTVATVRQALSSDEAFVTFIATHDINSRYSKKSKEEIWTMFSGIVESNKGYLENRAAPKAIMREKREEISNELVKLQNEVEKAKADRDAQLADRLQMHQRKLEAAKDRHDRFVNMLMEVLNILKTPGDKIEATPTIIATQQTYADRKNQIANELVHLQRGQAMVKLPTGECLIQTYHPNEVEQLQQAQRLEDEEATKKQEAIKQLVEEKARSKRENKQIIIEHTRRNYCKPHAEVEAEIRRRQDGGEPSLSITRKHQV